MKFLFVAKPMKYEFLGVMYLSRILKDVGVEVKFHTMGDDIEELARWGPDFIGCSVMTGSQKEYIEYFSKLKKVISFTSIFGGPHPTFFPRIINEPSVDYVCRGEGERGILKILEKPKEKIILEPLIEDLDSIPFPDRDILYQQKHHSKNPIRHFIMSRGCPFSCPYCFNSKSVELYKGQRWVRLRSPENMIEEIKQVVKKFPTKFIYFQDDLFIMNRDWVRKFCQRYKDEVGLPFHCLVRLDLLDEEIASTLSQAGCVCVRCAAESGNDYIREKLLKRRMTRQQIIRGAELLYKHKIAFVLQNMLGLPGTGLSEDIETLDLNIKCRPTLGWSSLFQPYPGTELGDIFPDISVDDISDSFYEDSIIDISQKKQRRRLQKLFGVVSQYPFLRSGLPVLLNLPLDEFYKKLWQLNNKRADKALYRGIL